jgi:hypothetical protein
MKWHGLEVTSHEEPSDFWFAVAVVVLGISIIAGVALFG